MSSIDYQVYLSGNEVTDWVIEKPNIVYFKNRLGELSEIPNADILVDNSNFLFTPFHEQSLIQDERERDVLIYEEDLLIYEGKLRHSLINTSDRTATLQSTALINEIIGNRLTPVSNLTVQTFSEISEYIYTLYNIEIDKPSYYRTKEKQEDLGLLGWINHTVEHGSSVMEVQQLLADSGFSRHYFIGNKAYMDFVDPFEDTTTYFTFTDDYILEIDNYQLIEKMVYDGYSVLTAAGRALEIGDSMAPDLDCSIANPIVMATPAGGHAWGTYQIELSKKRHYEISLQLVKDQYSYWLGLQTVFAIDSEYQGIQETFRVTSIDKNNDIFIVVTGESV